MRNDTSHGILRVSSFPLSPPEGRVGEVEIFKMIKTRHVYRHIGFRTRWFQIRGNFHPIILLKRDISKCCRILIFFFLHQNSFIFISAQYKIRCVLIQIQLSQASDFPETCSPPPTTSTSPHFLDHVLIYNICRPSRKLLHIDLIKFHAQFNVNNRFKIYHHKLYLGIRNVFALLVHYHANAIFFLYFPLEYFTSPIHPAYYVPF